MTRPLPAFSMTLIRTWEKGPSGDFAKTSYMDCGVPCIGWGCRITNRADPLLHQAINLEQADALAIERLADVQIQLEANLGDKIVAALTDNQYAALLDFVFNVGIGSFAVSPYGSTLRKKIDAGDFEGVAQEFGRWVYMTDRYGKKVPNQGLRERRAKEASLWRSGGNPFSVSSMKASTS